MANKPKEIVVVGSKVKEVVRAAGLRSDGELVSAVSDKVHEMLTEAIARCTSNGRSTVRTHDLGPSGSRAEGARAFGPARIRERRTEGRTIARAPLGGDHGAPQ